MAFTRISVKGSAAVSLPKVVAGQDKKRLKLGIQVSKRTIQKYPYGSKTNLREKWASGSLAVVVADDAPEHVPIADRTFDRHGFQAE
jgi:hypothetical protein